MLKHEHPQPKFLLCWLIAALTLSGLVWTARAAEPTIYTVKFPYKRYSGARGFTPEQFRKTAEDVAGVDLKEWFGKAISSVEELDYAEALDWFGLHFAEATERSPADAWRLEIRADASAEQKSRLQKWLGRPASYSSRH